jgi:cell division protein FtsB
LHAQNDELIAENTELTEKVADQKDEIETLKETENMLRDQIEVQDNDSGNDDKLKDLQSNYQ